MVSEKKMALPTKTRKTTMTVEVWEEIKLMYETGNYTQRQLAEHAKSKGFSCYQTNIARRAEKYNWVKGSLRDEIREEVLKEYKQTMGGQLVDMLLQHTSVARMMQAEVLRHFQKLAEDRKVDKNRVLSANQLATLVNTAKTLQDMEARSFGWNYKEGKPYSGDNEDVVEELPVLRVEVMTEEEEQEIREQGERRLLDMVG